MEEEIEQPEYQGQKSKKRGLLGLFFASFSKVLPASLVGLLGGPVAAGAVVALAGALVIGAPSAYFALKSQSAPVKKSKDSSFAKFFGGQGLTESLLPEEMRAAALEEEEARSDEETSLGLLIPEEIPGAKKEDEEEIAKNKEKRDPSLATYGEKKLDKEDFSKMKERFGSQPMQLAGGGGGSGSSAMVGGGGSQIGLGGAGGALGAAAGRSGKSSRTAVKLGRNLKAQKAGALAAAKKGAALSQKAYGFDQLASGYGGAAFGEGKTMSILPNVGGAVVSGPAGIETQANTQNLEGLAPGGGSSPDEETDDGGGGGGAGVDWANVGIMTGILAGGLLAAWWVSSLAQKMKAQHTSEKIGLGIAVALVLAGLWYAYTKFVAPLFGQGPLGVIIGLIMTAATALITWLIMRAYLWAQSPFSGSPLGAKGGFLEFEHNAPGIR